MTLIEPANVPIPRYGAGALSDVVPAVLASIGTPGCTDVLGLPPAVAACVFLVDGLGAAAIRAHSADAPVLHAALTGACGREVTAGFPSTTAVSIGSVGTGRVPGEHGIVGYQVRVPAPARLMNSLRWDPAVDPLIWQPGATAFERAEAAGTRVVQVAKRAFEGSGLSRAALRGGLFVGADTFGEVGAGALAALDAGVRERRPSLVYAYVSDLDWTGHAHGVASRAWRLQLQLIDRLVEQIATALPAGTRLYVTADHGMLDIAPDRRIDVDAEPDLAAGVELLGGEARARYLYTRPGAADDVLATWRERLGADAVVCTRDEAIEAGWFGPVAPMVRDRIGDVVAAMVSDIAVIARQRNPSEARLVGHHGSFTPNEQLVPLAGFGCP